MSASERIGKLFLLFLRHPAGLSFRRIRRLMPEAYRGDEEAVRKKFQRDRHELRALGLHLDESRAGAAGNEDNRVLIPSATSRTLLRELKLTDRQTSYLGGLVLRRIGENPLYRSVYLKLFHDQTEAPGTIDSGESGDPTEFYPEDTRDIGPILQDLQEAMAAQRRIRMTYMNARGAASERTIQPLAINNYRRVWYLSAYCDAAKDYRLFQVDRISNLQRLQQAIDSHPPEIFAQLKPHPLNLRREELQRIVVTVSPNFEEHFDHFTRELLPGFRLRTGALRREISTHNPEALFFWIFKNPGAVSGLGPAQIHRRFKIFLSDIAILNGGAPCP